MATTANVKKNGIDKKPGETNKKPVPVPKIIKPAPPVKSNSSDVTKDLAQEAIGQEPVVSIEDRILQVEKLKGLTDRHKRATATLNSLSEFKYNSSESCKITIIDDAGKSFTTGDINLIRNIADSAEAYIKGKKQDVENDLKSFTL
ncbi:hypothetical protein [Aquimarina macrocephali]|uniref:hypothetical protein n=1 Tax=Aquimarina macrocephali TaxID=666563 RepID=UPI0004661263|nr:hypothetical protein [Aquimarina macrocephali]